MSTTNLNELLDGFIPLRNASHADVSRYSIEIPMRYCECVASLEDGRKARLVDARAFVGWSCNGAERSYLFRSGDLLIEIRARTGQPASPAGRDLPVDCGKVTVKLLTQDDTQMIPTMKASQSRQRYTGIDGDLFILN